MLVCAEEVWDFGGFLQTFREVFSDCYSILFLTVNRRARGVLMCSALLFNHFRPSAPETSWLPFIQHPYTVKHDFTRFLVCTECSAARPNPVCSYAFKSVLMRAESRTIPLTISLRRDMIRRGKRKEGVHGKRNRESIWPYVSVSRVCVFTGKAWRAFGFWRKAHMYKLQYTNTAVRGNRPRTAPSHNIPAGELEGASAH